MRKILILFFAMITYTGYCQTYEYIARATIDKNIDNHILVDSLSGTNFILDSSNIYISAVNLNNDTIWKTDPWKDNSLMEYRVKRPIIARYYLANNKWTGDKEVIWIVYNNTQFGIVDKETGKFQWFGQD